MNHRPLILVCLGVLASAAPVSAAVRSHGVSIRIEEPIGNERHSEIRGGPLAPIVIGDGVLFRLLAPGARRVSVVGEFNGWNESADPLQKKRNGLWRGAIPLDDGEWAYLFVVDGEWMRDPDNPVLVPIPPSVSGVGEASRIRIRRNEVVDPRPAHFQEAEFHLDGTYDRANQVTLIGGIGYGNRAALHPDLAVRAGYAWGRERWLYDVGITQPILGEHLFAVGASAYRLNANPDEERIGTTENTLATLFFREDWRDYYEAEGFCAHAALAPAPHVELAVRWSDEEHRSVSKTTDWGLFGGDKRMRANLPIDDGRLRGLTVSGDVDTRNHERNPTRGIWLRGSYGWTGGGFGGDYEFRKGTVDLRRYMKVSRGRYFDVRFAGGVLDKARRGGGDTVLGYPAAPVQERFYLGGTGTMRATQFKSIQGDRMVLMNAEMRVDVFEDLQAVVFADVGDAWIEDTESADLHTDAGIGIQDSDSSFRINVAKKMDRESNEGVFVSARIQRMF